MFIATCFFWLPANPSSPASAPWSTSQARGHCTAVRTPLRRACMWVRGASAWQTTQIRCMSSKKRVRQVRRPTLPAAASVPVPGVSVPAPVAMLPALFDAPLAAARVGCYRRSPCLLPRPPSSWPLLSSASPFGCRIPVNLRARNAALTRKIQMMDDAVRTCAPAPLLLRDT